jgi:phage-related protein
MTEFFKSAEGKDALGDMVEALKMTAAVIGWVVNAFLWLLGILADFDDAMFDLGVAFGEAYLAVTEFWDGLVETVKDAVNSAKEFLGGLVKDVTTFFEELPGKIGEFISTAVDFVIEKIKAVPGAIAEAFDLALDALISNIGLAIALVIVTFTDLPGQIMGALEALGNTIVDAFNWVLEKLGEIIESIITYVQGLPEKIGAFFTQIREKIVEAITVALDFLSSLPGKIAGYFQSVRDQAVTKIDSFIETVRGIPGRVLTAIGDLGRLLYNAGQKVITGLIDGIGSRITQLRESISKAVQEIRDHLPFSPAKTGPLSGSGSPQLAGAKISEMIASGIESQLDLIAEAAALAAGSTVLPGLGQPQTPFQDAAGPPLVGPTGGQQGSPLAPVEAVTTEQPIFIVQIGDEQIEAFITKVVQEQVAIETRRVLAGMRS